MIAIVGPTGAGKSSLAVSLAQKFNGEIINADSRQVYRYMDIGTAKPPADDFARVPHHLYDIIDPDADFSLAQFQDMAYEVIQDIHKRKKIPFLVGGSGQYIWGVLEGWEIPRVPPDPDLRDSLEKQIAEIGIDGLFARLQELDPVGAQKIDKRNIRRVIRALEVSLQSGAPFSGLKKKNPPDYNSLIIGLTAERTELYRRTDSRIDSMMQTGLVQETQKLEEMGYGANLPSMSSIGYKQIAQMLKGEIDQEEAVRQIKTSTHRFIRHQYAWFRLKDERIHWFDIKGLTEPEVVTLIEGHLEIFSSVPPGY